MVKSALAFFEKYPTPHTLEGITINQLTIILLEASNNSVSKRKAEEILSLVTADGDTKREYQEHRDFLVQSLVRDIQFKKQEITYVKEELKVLMDKLDYKLDTMLGIDLVTAPVHFSLGGKGKDKKSKQGNRTLHGLFYFLAVQQVQISKGSKIPRNPVFYEYYQRKLKEGKTKGQALV